MDRKHPKTSDPDKANNIFGLKNSLTNPVSVQFIGLARLKPNRYCQHITQEARTH